MKSVRVGIQACKKDQAIKVLVNAIATRVDSARNLVPNVVEVDLVIAPHIEQAADVATRHSRSGYRNPHTASSTPVEEQLRGASRRWPRSCGRRAGLLWKVRMLFWISPPMVAIVPSPSKPDFYGERTTEPAAVAVRVAVAKATRTPTAVGIEFGFGSPWWTLFELGCWRQCQIWSKPSNVLACGPGWP